MMRFLFAAFATLVSVAGHVQAGVECGGFNTAGFFKSAELEDVDACIEAGADLFATDGQGRTPLFHAVAASTDPRIVDLLLSKVKEARPDAKPEEQTDRAGLTLMHVAAAEAVDPAMMTWLASWGASVIPDHDCGEGWLAGCTEPLHLAAKRRDGFMFVATLLAIGAMRDNYDQHDQTPADHARRLGADGHDMLALLTRDAWHDEQASRVRRAKADDADCDGFLTASFFEDATAARVNTCLAQGAYPTATDSDGNTALHLAAMHARAPQVIDALLGRLREDDLVAEGLARTNLQSHTPVHVAAQSGSDPRVLARLLAWGGDPNALAPPIERRLLGSDRGTTALHLAARRTDPLREGIVTVLLAAGAKTTLQDHGADGAGGRQALHYAVARDPDLRVITLLVVSENAQASLARVLADFAKNRTSTVADDRKRTALHVAAAQDVGIEVIAEMLWHGFSPDDADVDGYTPLMRAAEKTTDPEVFLVMLDYSKTPCKSAADGTTVIALLRVNQMLMKPDLTGREVSPIEAFRERCPS